MIRQEPSWSLNGQIEFIESRETVRYTSQVCSHWRLVSLQCPLLWDSIVLGKWWSLQWSKELLRRSALAPIDILCFGRLAKPFSDPGFGPKVRSFQGWYCNARTWKVLSTWLDHPQCQLKNISFIHDFDSESNRLQSLPLNTASSSVEHIYLSNCSVNLQTFAFSNISNLTLNLYRGRNNPRAPQYTPFELLSALSSMPLITAIRLGQALSTQSSTASFPYVHLPHLRELNLDEEYSPGSDFLVHLSLPPSCCLVLAFTNLQLDHKFSTIVGLISSRIIHDAKQEGASVKIDFWSHLVTRLASNRGTICNSFNIYNPNAPEDLWLSFIHPILSSIREVFPSITSLTLGLNEFHSSLIPYLGEFRNVRSLHVVTVASITLGHVLETSQPFAAAQDPKRIVFPSLCTISVVGDRLLFNNQLRLGMFVDFLRWRTAIGSRIENIQILYEGENESDITDSVTPAEIQTLEGEGVRVEVILGA